MTLTATCPHCAKSFQFDPASAPAQRIRAGWRTNRGLVVGYYPSCPHCGRAVEVGHPPARLAPAGRKAAGQ